MLSYSHQPVTTLGAGPCRVKKTPCSVGPLVPLDEVAFTASPQGGLKRGFERSRAVTPRNSVWARFRPVTISGWFQSHNPEVKHWV